MIFIDMFSQGIFVQEDNLATDVTLVENHLDDFKRSVSVHVVGDLNLMLAKCVGSHEGQEIYSTTNFAFSFTGISEIVAD